MFAGDERMCWTVCAGGKCYNREFTEDLPQTNVCAGLYVQGVCAVIVQEFQKSI